MHLCALPAHWSKHMLGLMVIPPLLFRTPVSSWIVFSCGITLASAWYEFIITKQIRRTARADFIFELEIKITNNMNFRLKLILHTTHYTLHTTHYTLHTTHYTLHTTHYTLHTTTRYILLRLEWFSLTRETKRTN
jgi:hypothetical protein